MGKKICFTRIAQLNVPAVDAVMRKTTYGVLRIRNLDLRYSLSYSPHDLHPLTVGKLVAKQTGTARIVILVVLLSICARYV